VPIVRYLFINQVNYYLIKAVCAASMRTHAVYLLHIVLAIDMKESSISRRNIILVIRVENENKEEEKSRRKCFGQVVCCC